MTTSLNSPASTSNRRVRAFHALPSSIELREELPLPAAAAERVERDRDDVAAIIQGADDRLLVVVGPCSIHDPEAAIDYAGRLAPLAEEYADVLKVVMRVYFEKPRTTVGWKGLINDPDIDETYDVHKGLRIARRLLLDILDLGLPVGCEFLEPTSPQYIADTVAWGAIGARTTESQVHRQLASGLSMPIGFKNATDGNVQLAIDGVQSASNPHVFFGADDEGRAAVVETAGNENCHVILRGGRSGSNADAASVAAALDLIAKAGLPRNVMIDASHQNSGKCDIRQAEVALEIAERIRGGETGINGVMLESFLVGGAQSIDAENLVYGQSVTDKCMAWEPSVEVLRALGDAKRAVRG